MNVERIRQAIEHLKREDVVLGRHVVYDVETGLCCAVGEMAKVAFGTHEGPNGIPYSSVREWYGLHKIDPIFLINDEHFLPAERKAAVIAYLESLIATTQDAPPQG